MLGEFHLLRRLGRGGMADVYLAEQTSLRRQVAVKVLRSEYTTDAGYLKRFQQEATAAGTLTHPNIVQVYLIGEQDGVHFIAQEYVQGRNLKEFLSRKGPLDLPVALIVLRQVAAALQAAGAAGIVHRDIKPENILLTRKGEAKVADFGLAQLTLQGERVALTQVGITMGTPLYMSPEQVNGKPVDPRSDLYSFGVMAYHMLAGRPPFQGDTPLAIAVQHLNSECPPLQSLRPDVPQAVCAFVQKLMSKNRDDRYPDAQAVVQELKQLSRQASGKESELETPLVPMESTSSLPLKVAVWENSSWDQAWRVQWKWLVPACLLMAAAAGALGWVMRPGDPFAMPAPQESNVPNLGSAAAQYYFAMGNAGDPSAWEAVLRYYAHDRDAKLFCDRAELQLALIDLRQGQLAEAEQRFTAMLDDGVIDRDQYKIAHGKAGLAVVASFKRNYDESRNLLNQISQEKLDDPMLKAVTDAQHRNQNGT
ncbi:MAG: serine/threonine-protein kinase [Planctomycetaceae bacterium]